MNPIVLMILSFILKNAHAIVLFILFVLMLIYMTGCSEYRLLAGAGAHSNTVDNWQAENPIGFIRGEANYYWSDTVSTGVYCNHTSQILVTDRNGFNHCGIQGGVTWRK